MKKFNELSEKDQKMLLRFMEKEKGKIYAKTPANEENNILNTIEEEKNEEEKESEDIKQINIWFLSSFEKIELSKKMK